VTLKTKPVSSFWEPLFFVIIVSFLPEPNGRKKCRKCRKMRKNAGKMQKNVAKCGKIVRFGGGIGVNVKPFRNFDENFCFAFNEQKHQG
jgi:hypothetical protein